MIFQRIESYLFVPKQQQANKPGQAKLSYHLSRLPKSKNTPQKPPNQPEDNDFK
jgi:hypothetical protein